jgi:WD40 repeat protein
LPDEEVISPRLGVRGRLHIGSRPGSWREVATLSWSPDATWIAVPVWGSNGPPTCATKGMEFETCYLLFASDGSATAGLTDEAGGYLAWAPDGRVAVAHAYEGTVQVWPSQRDPDPQDGGLPYTIPVPSQPFGHALAWSPDDSRLLVGGQFFALGGDDPQPFTCDCVQLYTIGEDRSPVALSEDPLDGFLGMVAWAPRGDRILFSTSSDGGPEPVGASIWSIDADGGTATKLTDTTEVIFDVAGVSGS